MRRTLAALLIVTAILLGALAAGSPVNGVESVAKTTAGIELSTHAPATPRPVLPAPASAIRQAIVLLLLVAVVSLARVGDAALWAKARSLLRWQGSARRGPPALA